MLYPLVHDCAILWLQKQRGRWRQTPTLLVLILRQLVWFHFQLQLGLPVEYCRELCHTLFSNQLRWEYPSNHRSNITGFKYSSSSGKKKKRLLKWTARTEIHQVILQWKRGRGNEVSEKCYVDIEEILSFCNFLLLNVFSKPLFY